MRKLITISKKSVIALLFTFSVTSASATIVYTDVNPDFTTTLDPVITYASNLLAVDFNGDGTEEYNFRWDDYGSAGWYMHMTFASNNEFVLKGTATNPFGGRYLQALNANTSIGASSANWGNSFPEPFIGDNSDPNFQGLGDMYVGVKFKLNGNTHYGWVLVSFDSGKTLTVKGYAYEDKANTAIQAGDMGSGLGVDENVELLISFLPNPASDYIVIKNDSPAKIESVSIYSVDGKLVYSQHLAINEERINIESLSKGVYVIEIYMENGKLNRSKLIRE